MIQCGANSVFTAFSCAMVMRIASQTINVSVMMLAHWKLSSATFHLKWQGNLASTPSKRLD
jgi:hypothetical protein